MREEVIQWTPAKKVVVAGAAVAMGLVVLRSRRRWREHNDCVLACSLDPHLDSSARAAVLAALVREHDPSVLFVLQSKLAAAGHDKTARTVGERASEIARANAQDHVAQEIPSHASMVFRAQQMLRRLGYAVGATGFQDDATTLAVKHFQSLHGLDMGGVIDGVLLAALGAALRSE